MRTGKLECRKYFRQLQASFLPDQFRLWNEGLAPHLLEVAREIPAGAYVAVYYARGKEAELASLFRLPLRLCFPRIVDRAGHMEFRWMEKVTAPEFHVGPYGILEPKETHPLVPKEVIHSAFVPLLAFDEAGRRLGQGKGFYDRFLEGFPGRRIGVAFEWQRSPEPLPVDEHDEPLHAIVTEHGVHRLPEGLRS